MQRAVLGAEASCIVSGSFNGFICPCFQLRGCGCSELPELIFGFIFMIWFSVFGRKRFGVFCKSTCLNDLFSAVSVCWLVGGWTSVRTKVPL